MGASRRVAAAVAALLVAQLTASGVILAGRLHSAGGQSRLVVRGEGPVASLPATPEVPLSSPRPLPRVRVHRPPIPKPSLRPLRPVPRLPKVPKVPSVGGCPALAGSKSEPNPTTQWPLSTPGLDVGGPVRNGSTVWFPATTRDGKFATRLVGVDTKTGATHSTSSDPFFRLGAVVGNYAWGIDNDGVAQFDLGSGAIRRRWSSFWLPNGSGSVQAVPAFVTSDGRTIYVVTVGGQHVGMSGIDANSGSVRWTTELPTGAPSAYSGNAVVVGPNGVYVALNNADYRTGIHVWRLSTSGSLLADRAISVPLIVNESPALAVSSDGVFVTAVDSTSTQHGHLFSLDPVSLKMRVQTTIDVWEGLYTGQGSVWTISLPCNTFLLSRYDPVTLHRKASYRLASMSYGIDVSSPTAWVLVTKSPAEAVRLEALPL
jgi:PQQ-like domain